MAGVASQRSAGGGEADTPYFTVAQAARRLQVSPSTIWRWIDAKKLRAYRIGEKTIRVRREDLEAIVRPTDAAIEAATGSRTKPLGDEESARGLAALRRAAVSRAEQLARRGGQPFPPSSDLVREIREELSARR